MSNDRQWMFTKMVGGLLALLLLISTAVGGANMFFDLKRDVKLGASNHADLAKDVGVLRGDTTEELKESRIAFINALKENADRDFTFREKIGDELDDAESERHLLALANKELLIHYQEILRRLGKSELNDQRILDKIDSLEYAGD